MDDTTILRQLLRIAGTRGLRGDKGEKGDKGDQGDPGADGADGDPGPNTVTTSTTTNLTGLFYGNGSNVSAKVLDNDNSLAANSSDRIATQSAVKAYIDALLAANDAVVLKGVIDCSSNPNYPAASAGHLYKVSVAGKIGGASGQPVEAGDTLLCTVDSTAAGNQATVGSSWAIIQVNIDGAVMGPTTSVNGNFPSWSGTGGKTLVDSGYGPASFATPSDLSAYVAKSLVDAKGDVLVGTADNTITRVGIGSNDTFFIADSAQSAGVKWAGGSTARNAMGLGTVATLAVDTDGTLAANSDIVIASQKAMKTYVNNRNAWKRAAKVVASGSPSNIDLTNTLYGLGSFNVIRATGWAVPSTNSVTWAFRYSSNDGSSFDSGTYNWTGDYTIPTVTAGDGNYTTFSYGYLCDSIQNTTDIGIVFTIWFFNFGVARPTLAMIECRVRRAGNITVMGSSIYHSSATAWNAIRFFFDSGTIASSEILIEGVD